MGGFRARRPAGGSRMPSSVGFAADALVGHNPRMARAAPSYLDRFPLISTRDLSAARETTGRFWPKHSSEVLGPEAYSLEMNRVLLGHLAVSYVFCTTSIQVVPREPGDDSSLYVPFDGGVETLVDGRQLAGSRSRPLLRGAFRTSRFVASPIRCLVVDIPAAVIAAAAAEAEVPPPSHVSLGPPHAKPVVRLVKRLASLANRSRTVAAIQPFSASDRLKRTPDSIQRLERQVVDAIVQAAMPGGLRTTRLGSAARCDVEDLKAWLAGQLHRRVRIGELTKRAGASKRTIERAFLRTGCTPMEYLRSVRLERARCMFARPTPGMTVADAAGAVGYTHLGRFAAEYRRQFGELPSRTLARGRSRQPGAE